jgi:hypothetical protein
VAIITGLPSPAFNGVWCEGPDVPAATIKALIDEVAGAGAPFFVESRPVNRALVAGLAAERGLVLAGYTPLMTLDGQDGAGIPQVSGSVSIRPLAPHEAPVHARLISAVHGLPEDALLRYVSEDAPRPGLAPVLRGRGGQAVKAAEPGGGHPYHLRVPWNPGAATAGTQGGC